MGMLENSFPVPDTGLATTRHGRPSHLAIRNGRGKNPELAAPLAGPGDPVSAPGGEPLCRAKDSLDIRYRHATDIGRRVLT